VSARAGIILAVTLLAGCTGTLNRELVRSPDSLAYIPQGPELALLEFRLARHFATRNVPTTCAGVSEGTISAPRRVEEEARLLARFTRLRPLSQCKFDGARFTDRGTGDPAIVFDVHDLACETPTSCTAWAGFRQDQKVNGWSFYRATFRGYWRISREDLGIELTAPPSGAVAADEG
jgi:hypothetical protein